MGTKEDQMSKTRTALSVWAAAVLALGAVTIAQTGSPAPTQANRNDRFTFMIPNAPQVGSNAGGRFDLIIKHWSTDAERDAALSALKEGGPTGLRDAIRNSSEAGYLNWPGNL